ncbi:asparagine synthase (glutamine-hydrolyzing) [Nocardia sp. NBC_00565]|uniref:asparagine synthase (glutamine-hydrolyzing) n=1 Tax=Nocardia sp. NBC_00565 TaxID=2975993 RepID=UPI002E81ED83|nr:asparagine synthase (glutamine-hydrolyzing) [Nocardia sp. NBC_00565]WUC07503.1 asparagine synthase (glutamine-hydrolyzing) [Nocardia sp. NBC_00565]
MYSGCGIAGTLVHTVAAGPVPGRADVERMTAALAHRGPDAGGFWCDDAVMFGHRRLSIVGLGDAGTQPMTRAHLTITYNGELYNFRALRRELGAEFVFESETDTEVVLRAWQRWGPAALQRFRGMFAFAIWDQRARCLTLVRDRLGIKPLYFHHGPSWFSFASEAEALLQCTGVPRRPDLDTIRHRLLCSSTLEVDPWRTALDGVRSVPPATYLAVTADGNTSSTTYWSLPETNSQAQGSTAELTELLADSVQTMLAADVPVATFLSGGLDSSAITALAARHGPLTAVTIAYAAQDPASGVPSTVNEDTRYSRTLIEHLSADVDHRIHVRPNTIILDDIDTVCDLAAVNDDVRHVSILANYRTVHDLGLRVVLNGQGADETMAGYVGRANFIANILDIRSPDEALIRRLPASRQAPGLSSDVLRHRRTADAAVLEVLHREPGTALERAHRLLVGTQVARIVQFEDFLAMRMTIEARFPFLDHPIVEWCFAAPFQRHIHPQSRQGKMLLRASMHRIIPDTVLSRPKAVFPYPAKGELHRSLVALARRHEQSLRADPLVTALFTMPPSDLATWPVDLLWLVLAMWRCGDGMSDSIPWRIDSSGRHEP